MLLHNDHEGPAQPYNEEAFRYLLAVERERCDRSGGPFLLLLMAPAPRPGVRERIARPVARKLFASLRLCLRETDFVGWYHEERVAAAVLTDLGGRTAAAVGRRVGETIGKALRESCSPDVAHGFQVRVYEHAEPGGARPAGGFTLDL
jgi:hypothetical protein